jgi:hypothetical protein
LLEVTIRAKILEEHLGATVLASHYFAAVSGVIDEACKATKDV